MTRAKNDYLGLMISSMARGGQVLGDTTFTGRAVKAARFLQVHLYREEDNTLLRSCYTSFDGGVEQMLPPIEGYVDDYAFVIRGLLDLFETTQDIQWLLWAEKLQARQDQLFWDEEGGGYFGSHGRDSSIVLRLKEVQDGAEPSANSVSSMNLLRLSSLLDETGPRNKAARILRLFSHHLTSIPQAVPELACGLIFHLRFPRQIIIVGSEKDTEAMMQTVHQRFIPDKILIQADGSGEGILYEKLPFLKPLTMLEGKATAYVCENFTCSLPTNSLQEFEKQLDMHI